MNDLPLLCRAFGHDLTGWAPALYVVGHVRGCVRCGFREYRDAPPETPKGGE